MKIKHERGQTIPIAAFLVCAMALVALLVAHVGAAGNIAARAQTAADAAALAGAADGRTASGRAAEANGALLTSLVRDGDEVLVTVSIGDRSAQARARYSGGLEAAEH